ncbi:MULTISPECIES: transposase [unclassified Okeania]|uniref:Transposase n=1 Tax=Okeania hirsuta TaxID=1458930 RepID=A0A3N6PAJ6_9CYAN|nr:transposase [Okeania sp. SIO2H7]NEP75761.1 transposase [Okeania sp. SIO2G5]NEP96929.1 transposase [Okeania sp. SIO2F5]NEQ94745.1 transposase [Okeania sp. SIO2G4]NES79045.1 transposase [Okeania sp. SIO1H4]NES92396.1 transposase [Okeania sp. SIO2B9]NET16656.1 transposase [Okeania sp. SIO1H6]NET22708.1 transposase [Okeania sp. SIO1H5]NET79086.1 transposase [Okeania sp. SIO1F9]NET97365.1 transposase [Okeania sp. SIO1H2]RQH21080.1 transposase [Okeania hirsuta]
MVILFKWISEKFVWGIFYVQRTGFQWEMMPHDLPPYTTVYRYFHQMAASWFLATSSRSSSPKIKNTTRQGSRLHRCER